MEADLIDGVDQDPVRLLELANRDLDVVYARACLRDGKGQKSELF